MTQTARSKHMQALQRRLADLDSAIPAVPAGRVGRLTILTEEQSALRWVLGILARRPRAETPTGALKETAETGKRQVPRHASATHLEIREVRGLAQALLDGELDARDAICFCAAKRLT